MAGLGGAADPAASVGHDIPHVDRAMLLAPKAAIC
jgi:hypothetical protein